MVPASGIEPERINPRDFKSLVSTYFTMLALILPAYNNTGYLAPGVPDPTSRYAEGGIE